MCTKSGELASKAVDLNVVLVYEYTRNDCPVDFKKTYDSFLLFLAFRIQLCGGQGSWVSQRAILLVA